MRSHMNSYLPIRKSSAALTAVGIITVGINLFLGATPQAQGPTVHDGIYTAAQAARGKAFYTQTCSPCHGDEPTGSPNAPSLSGDEFMRDFVDSSVFDVWDLIVKTMPANNPGI